MISPSKISSRFLIADISLLAGDFLAVTLAVWLAFEARGLFRLDVTIPQSATVIYPIWLGTAWLEGLYPGWGMSPVLYARRVTRAVVTTFLLTTAVLYFAHTGPGWARFVLLTSALLGWVFVPALRWAGRQVLLRIGAWGVPVAVLGAGVTGSALVAALGKARGYGFVPVAVYDDNLALTGKAVAGVPVVGPLAQASKDGFSTVFLAIPSLGEQATLGLLRGSLAGVRNVFIVPDLLGLSSAWVQARDVTGMLTLEVQRHLLRRDAQLTKRALDLLGCVVGGVLVLPLFLGVALAVILDSRGGVFYRQRRIGRGGRELRVWKFRTMQRDAERVLSEYLAVNRAAREEWQRDQKLREDPRITRVGRFLRRASLDELPQLFNVLAGEMSLVGPRPIVFDEVVKYGEDFEVYTQVLPGMTGLWQTSGRNDTGYSNRVALDVYYIRNWSVWLDLVVLLNTPLAVFDRRGAY